MNTGGSAAIWLGGRHVTRCPPQLKTFSRRGGNRAERLRVGQCAAGQSARRSLPCHATGSDGGETAHEVAVSTDKQSTDEHIVNAPLSSSEPKVFPGIPTQGDELLDPAPAAVVDQPPHDDHPESEVLAGDHAESLPTAAGGPSLEDSSPSQGEPQSEQGPKAGAPKVYKTIRPLISRKRPRFLQHYPTRGQQYNVNSFIGKKDPHNGQYLVQPKQYGDFLTQYHTALVYFKHDMYLMEIYGKNPYSPGYFRSLTLTSAFHQMWWIP